MEMVVGVDLVEVSEVLGSIERFGDRYLRRLFTDDEIAYCRSRPEEQERRFAARFAAKEAVIKVLRAEERPDFRSIEVRRSPSGWCRIALHGAARSLAEEAGIYGLALSMSHESKYATAVVVARRSRLRSFCARLRRTLSNRRLGR